MPITHRDHVQSLLSTAAAQHAGLLAELPAALTASLPVDVQEQAAIIIATRLDDDFAGLDEVRRHL